MHRQDAKILEVRSLLENKELKITLDSPDGDYRFEYFSSVVNDERTKQIRTTRSYRVHDVARQGITPEPWGPYDIDKQTTLVENLIRFSHYRISRIVSGWTATCPNCGYVMRGQHWENAPTKCKSSAKPKCVAAISVQDVQEIALGTFDTKLATE